MLISKANHWIESDKPFGMELLATGKMSHGGDCLAPSYHAEGMRGFTYYRLAPRTAHAPKRPAAVVCSSSELGLSADLIARIFDLAIHHSPDRQHVALTRRGQRVIWRR